MIPTHLGIEYPESDRQRFLNDNADRVEEVGYLKPFGPEDMAQMKDELSTISINIDSIEEEKKEVLAGYAESLKPLKIKKSLVLSNLRNKAEHVCENCYAFFFPDQKVVGYYNSTGQLVDSRAMRPQEFQKTIFTDVQRGGELTGTDN